MATYAQLTDEQKSILQDWINFVRATCGEQARANNHIDVANVQYGAQVQAIINSLDAETLLPNTSGLAGAGSVTKEELSSVFANLQGLIASYNTLGLRQAFAKLAGPQNLIG